MVSCLEYREPRVQAQIGQQLTMHRRAKQLKALNAANKTIARSLSKCSWADLLCPIDHCQDTVASAEWLPEVPPKLACTSVVRDPNPSFPKSLRTQVSTQPALPFNSYFLTADSVPCYFPSFTFRSIFLYRIPAQQAVEQYTIVDTAEPYSPPAATHVWPTRS